MSSYKAEAIIYFIYIAGIRRMALTKSAVGRNFAMTFTRRLVFGFLPFIGLKGNFRSFLVSPALGKRNAISHLLSPK